MSLHSAVMESFVPCTGVVSVSLNDKSFVVILHTNHGLKRYCSVGLERPWSER